RGADARDVGRVHGVGVQRDVDRAVGGGEAFALAVERRGEAAAHLGQPADDGAAGPGILEVIPTGGVGLGAEADVAGAGQRGGRAFHRLAEGRAAVAAAVQRRPHVEVGVEVDQGDGAAGADVAEVTAEGGFVAAAEDDGDGPGGDGGADDLREGRLAGLQV